MPRRALVAAGLVATLGALLAQAFSGHHASAAAIRAGKKLTLSTKTFRMTGPDEKRRMVVRCPGRTIPYGGGMLGNPAPGPDGEGVYPHSYERLGVQHGWHVTPVLFDRLRGSTQPRDVTLQVMCGKQVPSVKRRRQILFVAPGETKTAVAKCPGPRHLIGGGFQRTDFVSRGGNYVTESRAISSKKWRVTGSAFGRFGGQLVAIVYCFRSKKPLVKEVSASTTLAPLRFGAVTTPPCPGKRKLVYGGFSSFPPGPVFLADGYFNRNRTWTASGFNYFGPAATVSAHGYCVRIRPPR